MRGKGNLAEESDEATQGDHRRPVGGLVGHVGWVGPRKGWIEGCESKVANVFVLRGPYLAMLVIGTLSWSRCARCSRFWVFVAHLEVVIGRSEKGLRDRGIEVEAGIARWLVRRSFICQRAAAARALEAGTARRRVGFALRDRRRCLL